MHASAHKESPFLFPLLPLPAYMIALFH